VTKTPVLTTSEMAIPMMRSPTALAPPNQYYFSTVAAADVVTSDAARLMILDLGAISALTAGVKVGFMIHVRPPLINIHLLR
jgi:hypothetical protein